MSLSAGRGMIADAIKDLMREWSRASEHWDDANARAFEAKYLDAIGPRARHAIEAMDKLSAVANAARRDCE